MQDNWQTCKYLQTMIGTVADGGIGYNTLAKLKEYVEGNGLEKCIVDYQAFRQSYYEKLSTFSTFGRGWTRRVDETTELAESMIEKQNRLSRKEIN